MPSRLAHNRPGTLHAATAMMYDLFTILHTAWLAMNPVVPLSALLWATVVTPPAHAHDLWLDKDGGYTLLQGHRHSAHSGAEILPYTAAFVTNARCLDAAGAAKSLPVGKLPPWKTQAECAALLVAASSGYWSKTPWETKNLPKTEVSGALRSWLSEEAVKRIDVWTPGTAQALGDGLEITPLANPFALKPGDKLTVLVSENKRPRAGVPVAYGGDTRGASGEDGKVVIRIRQLGTQLISASVETPLNDGRADVLVRSTALQFELPQ